MMRHPARAGGGLPRPRSRRAIGVTAMSTLAVVGLGAAVAAPASAQIRFANARAVALPSQVGAIAVADFDGDGLVDVAGVGDASPVVVVRLGSGTGTWGPATSFPAGPAPSAIAAADLDGDGDPDLAVTNGQTPTGSVSVLLGGAGGTFGPPTTLPAGDLPNSVDTADLTGDGREELIVTNAFSEDVRIYPGESGGSFGAPDVKAVGIRPDAVATGDFDGDGRLDLAVANEFSDSVSVFLGAEGGELGPRNDFPASDGPFDVEAGDLDADGDLDLMAVGIGDPDDHAPDAVAVMAGHGDGTFAAPVEHPVEDRPGALELGDLDGDGDLDAVVTNSRSWTVSVLRGGPGAAFVTDPKLAAPFGPHSPVLADLDGDPFPDLVVAHTSSSFLTYRNITGNGAPIAHDDAFTVAEDQVLRDSLSANDEDPDGDPLSPELVTAPAHGTFLPEPDGTFSYTPVPDFAGVDTFTYRTRDSAGDPSEPATVTITVEPSPDPPVADDETFDVDEDTTLEVSAPGVLDGDVDADGDPLTAAVIDAPGHGTLALEADGGLTYTPDGDFSGADSFTYTSSDGDFSDQGTVSITVRPVADDPVAVADAYEVAEDQVLEVGAPGLLTNDTDADGDHLTLAQAEAPAHGQAAAEPDGSFRYTPDPDFAGEDSFAYWIHDGTGHVSALATVTITVVPDEGDPPVARDDSFQIRRGEVLGVEAPGVLENDVDPEGDPLTAELVSGPADTQAFLNPDGSFGVFGAEAGTHVFTYIARSTYLDGEGNPVEQASDEATITVEVSPNDPPDAVDDAFATDEGVPLTIPAADLLVNDTDPDGDALGPYGLGLPFFPGPQHGTAEFGSGPGVTVVYTPNPGFSGTDSFTYTVSDGAFSDEATVEVTVRPTAPRLTLGDASVVEKGLGESATLRVPATLSAPAPADVTFRWSTADGTAAAPDDYTARVNRFARIPAGATSVSLSVPVAGDALDEDDETVTVTAGSLVGAVADDTAATGTIQDDDPAPSVSIGDVAIAEGNSGTRNAVFELTLSAPALRSVRVGWSTADGTAAAGSDYTARADRFVTFLPGQTSRTVSVPVVGDAMLEDDETFAVNLAAGTYGTVADGEGVATILDEDLPEPTISIGDVTVIEGNSGSKSAVLTVTLSNQSTRRVDVGWSTQDGTAVAGSDYTARLTQTLTFSAGQTRRTVSVPILGDRATEPSEAFAVQLTATGYGIVADGAGAVTITDND